MRVKRPAYQLRTLLPAHSRLLQGDAEKETDQSWTEYLHSLAMLAEDVARHIGAPNATTRVSDEL